MDLVRSIIETVVGLIVDDGLVVVGAIIALLVTGALTALAPGIPGPILGLLLFLMVAASLLASLLRAAVDARHHAVESPTDAG